MNLNPVWCNFCKYQDEVFHEIKNGDINMASRSDVEKLIQQNRTGSHSYLIRAIQNYPARKRRHPLPGQESAGARCCNFCKDDFDIPVSSRAFLSSEFFVSLYR